MRVSALVRLKQIVPVFVRDGALLNQRCLACRADELGQLVLSLGKPLLKVVNFKSGEVRLDAGTTKNRDGRVVIMTDDLRTLLEQRQRETKEAERTCGQIIPWVFFRMVAETRGGEKKPKRISAFTKAWKNACISAGCPGRIPHDLRRTAVRNMVRCGVPERVAMKLTGHKTRSVFERYNIVSDGDLDAAAIRMNGLMGSKTGSTAGSPADSVVTPNLVTRRSSAS